MVKVLQVSAKLVRCTRGDKGEISDMREIEPVHAVYNEKQNVFSNGSGRCMIVGIKQRLLLLSYKNSKIIKTAIFCKILKIYILSIIFITIPRIQISIMFKIHLAYF